MLKLWDRSELLPLCAASALLSLLVTTPVLAASDVTFVSGHGTDTGVCATQARACRTFVYALSQTNAGGEIKALDPADYADTKVLVINKSVSITGVEGASLVRKAAGDAVTVSALAAGAVSLANLIIDGSSGTATHGVRVTSAGKLSIKNCVIRNFTTNGVSLFSSVATQFLIEDLTVSGNGQVGVFVAPTASGGAEGVINRVTSSDNAIGVRIVGNAGVTVSDSLMLNNASDGVLVGSFATATGARTLRLGHSTISGSLRGVRVIPGFGYTAYSVGNNFLAGNPVEVDGTLTPITPR